MPLNGRIDLHLMTEMPSMRGAYLMRHAADSWEALRGDVDHEYGWTPRITSTVDAYRPYTVQERIFRQRYTRDRVTGIDPRQWNGRIWWRLPGFAAAAVPGTSNHGLGITVDVADMRYGSTRFNQFAKVATRHGWSNAEGRSVNEAWHWTKVNAGTAVAPTPLTPEDDMFEPADRNLLQHVVAMLSEVPGRTANAVASVPVSRVEGAPTTWLGDSVAGTTAAMQASAQIAALTTAVQVLAAGRGLDPEAITAAAAEGARRALADIRATVTIDTKEP